MVEYKLPKELEPFKKELKVFEPATNVAIQKIAFMVSSGAKIFNISKTQVKLRSKDRIATVDQWSRVEWK